MKKNKLFVLMLVTAMLSIGCKKEPALKEKPVVTPEKKIEKQEKKKVDKGKEEKVGKKDDKKEETKEETKEEPKTEVKKEVNEVKKTKEVNEVKEELGLKDYNDFVGTSYEKVFNNWLKTKENGHLVYSPYSYKKAFEGLGNLTEDFRDNKYIGKVSYSTLSTPSNITTDTVTMLNKDMFETNDERFKVVSFKKGENLSEAEKTSKDLQNRVLNEVLLAPDYDESLASVIVNATRFYGKWKEPFEKDMTQEGDFTTLDNSTVKKDIMQAGDLLKIGYEDELVTAGAKALESKNEDSFVYFISPKKWDDKSLTEVAKNIPNIVKDIHNFEVQNSNSKAKYYDKVFVAVPKMDIESRIELDEVEKNNGGSELFSPFKERDTIKRIGVDSTPLQISKITQVAKMRMDEEEIEAKAVTEMRMELTAMIPEEKTLLEIDCTHPHFVVTVSGGIISFIGFVGN